MAKLTEPMIIARAKSSDLNTIKKLNCWGNELTDVSLLQRMPNVEVLALSVNNISSLADFRYCGKLRELYLRKNSISRLNEVCYLQDCPALQNLTLTENPCTNHDGYRLAVLRTLPRLQKLDDVEVSEDERRSALRQAPELVHPEDEDGQSWSQQVPGYSSQDHNGYSNGVKYEISPDQTPPEMESPEPPRQYHDEYADRRNANYNSDSSGYSQRRDSTQSYHSSSQSYQQQPVYQPPTPNSPDPHPTPRRRLKDASPEAAPFVPPSPSSPPVLPQNTPTSSVGSPPEMMLPRFQSETRVCPEQLPLYPCNHQDEEYYYRQQQQQQPRNRYPTVQQQVPPSVPITGNGRPKSRTANILSAVLCLLKELDYQSLEVVDNTVNARMNELMHEHTA